MQVKSCFSKTSSIGEANIILKSYHEEKNGLLLKRIELGESKRNSGTHSRVCTPQSVLCVSDAFGKAVDHSRCVSTLCLWSFYQLCPPPSMVQEGGLADL